MNPFFFMRHVRVLPVTIASLSLLLCAKMVDIYHTGNQFSEMFLPKAAIAQEEAQPTPEAEKAEAPEPEGKSEAEAEAEAVPAAEQQVASLEENQPLEQTVATDKREFTEIELDILQSLSVRRDALDALEKDIRMKESVLDATEKRLDGKIVEIKNFEKTMKELLKEYDEKEDAKIRSLVKIYENMKPKEAARIFDELEMPILLLVADRMAERRAAPIFAKMTPLKAKQLTVELAEQRKVRAEKKVMPQ
jgi:flagellar motility protein MotE (MotC chaperone)